MAIRARVVIWIWSFGIVYTRRAVSVSHGIVDDVWITRKDKLEEAELMHLDHPDLWPEPSNEDGRRSNPRRYRPPPKNLSAIHDIRQLATILRQDGYRDVQGIPAASTPIVKFRDANGGFDCDINVNDLGGW
jgi:hypothetical protein